jgi:hypothetical protein
MRGRGREQQQKKATDASEQELEQVYRGAVLETGASGMWSADTREGWVHGATNIRACWASSLCRQPNTSFTNTTRVFITINGTAVGTGQPWAASVSGSHSRRA